MPCNKNFGKILKNVKKEYPKASPKRQMKMTWDKIKKQKK